MGGCFSCDWAPNVNIQTVAIDVQNAPVVMILEPSGNVRGVVNASIGYDFPPYYPQTARIDFERKTILGTYVTIASKTLTLNQTAPTAGTWNFTFDVSSWTDNEYTLRAKATYDARTNYDYQIIKVVKIPLSKEVRPQDGTYVAEPINVATGNMLTSHTDISIPSREIPLELSRTYNSQDDFNGSFGYGWRSNFDITLTEQADQSVIEVDEKGVYAIYTKNPDGTYKPSAGKYSILTKNPDSTYTIIREHGRKLYFDNHGRLVKIEERNGNAIDIVRVAAGQITEVCDASGRKLLFTQNAQGKIAEVKDPANRLFKYEYDASGNLVKTTGPLNNETLYQYTNHNLIQVTDANGHALHFEYDASDRAYHSWQESGNNEVTLLFDAAHKITTATDSRGNSTRYEYNDYGLVTKITDAQSKTQAFTWDANLNKTQATDPNGNTFTFTYDLKGNLTSLKDPFNHTTTFTYESNFNFLSSVTDALGNCTEYAYDPRGNLTQVQDALGNATHYTYDLSGSLFEVKDAANNLTHFVYDTYGNVTQISDALNNLTNFSHDVLGNAVEIIDPKGNPTAFTYDLLNRLIQVTYADNSQVSYAYDAVGNVINFIDQNTHTTAYGYGAVNRLVRVTDALGNLTQFAYDTEGNRLSVIDANTNQTQYLYDSLNRLIKTTNPLNRQASFTYDPNGNLTSKIDANGSTITSSYDALNRLAQVTYPDGSAVSFTYDALGRRVSMIDSTGTTTYTYDALGRLIQVDGPQNNDTIVYAYDILGRRIQMTNSQGITSYTYDALGRLLSLTDPQGNTTTYAYDAASNLTQMNYLNNTQASYAFDNLNRLISLTNQAPSGVISSYAYNYNPSGLRTRVTLSDGSSADYTYDALNRLTSEANNASQGSYSASYQFDNVGNRLSYSKTDYASFSDGFNRPDNSNPGAAWSVIAGDWKIDTNRLFVPNAKTDAIIVYSGQTIPNPIIESVVKLETVGNKKGSYIIFSYQNQNDFYYAGLEGTSDLWVMGHYQNGSYNDLVTLAEPIEKLIDYHIKVTVNLNTATLESLENNSWVTKLNYTFPSLPQGKVGLSVEKSRTKFDDFKASWQVTTSTAYTYNQLNQLIQSTTNSLPTDYTYDNNGNLISKMEGMNTTDYSYDFENRLTNVNLPNGVTAAYAYDGLGRRTLKNINNTPITYLYDQEDIISLETLTDTTFFTHGSGIDNPISMLKQSQPYYYHTDGLGSITNLTNTASQPIQPYRYDAYGNMLQPQENVPNPYTYTGREYDPETGLYYYRNRYYDSSTGRFITQDPLGMVNGPNLYTYVNNNPVNFVDPWGLCQEEPWWLIIGGITLVTPIPGDETIFWTGAGIAAVSSYVIHEFSKYNKKGPLWNAPGMPGWNIQQYKQNQPGAFKPPPNFKNWKDKLIWAAGLLAKLFNNLRGGN